MTEKPGQGSQSGEDSFGIQVRTAGQEAEQPGQDDVKDKDRSARTRWQEQDIQDNTARPPKHSLTDIERLNVCTVTRDRM
jgi:hypothetical protein